MATVLCVVVSLCNQIHHLDRERQPWNMRVFQEYDRCNCPTLATRHNAQTSQLHNSPESDAWAARCAHLMAWPGIGEHCKISPLT